MPHLACMRVVVSSYDPRKIAFMEKISGLNFVNGNSPAIATAKQSWELFFNEFFNRFMVQSVLHNAFPKANYDFANDKLTIGATLDEVITTIKSLAGSIAKGKFEGGHLMFQLP